MDPLSITVSIIGILGMAAKVTGTLQEFVRKDASTAASALRIIAEVSDLSTCLARLQPLLQSMKDAPVSRVAAITVDDIVVIATSCVTVLDDLDKLLDPYKWHLPLSLGRRIQWAREERKIQELVSRVQVSKSSITLILTILNWSVTIHLVTDLGRYCYELSRG